ncbi:hypothetical protein JDV09_15270 [Mycobacterium sp. Y57]|uniref:Vgb family protein n=1 Tax=Mycolicibacterium xanthum TaxID=2796469 RepID=UPI001C8494C2|nr:hypothetical protein [Mycolicibacterium xanthum]MBX7433460.1 hypothetical protein [Mycolicibacterium xanthum]
MAAIAVYNDAGFNAPSGIIAAAGDIWFTNIADHRVGRIRNGSVEFFADPSGAVKLPANIFPGSDGRVWFTSLGSDALGAIDPAAADPASTITTYPLPPGSRPVALKSGPDHRLWFSLRGTDSIGSIDPRAPGPIDTLRVFQSPDIAGPAALFVTTDGLVWWVNSTTDTVGSLNPTTSTVVAIGDLPGSPRAWTQTPDGMLWLTIRDPAGIMCFDPADPAASMRHATDGRLREPDGVWAGVDGAVWFADTAANVIVRYQPGVQGSAGFRLIGGPPEVDGPFDIKAGPDPADGYLWFTNKGGNSIGRIAVAARLN